MDYFMHCPNRPLEPPDDDTADNRRYWEIKGEIQDYEYLLQKKYDQLNELGFYDYPIGTQQRTLLEKIHQIAGECTDPKTAEKLDNLYDSYIPAV